MATFITLLSTFLAILIATASNTSPVTAIEEFKVGDSEGWRHPPADDTDFYTHWASKKRFHVGDSLRFLYTNDSVVVIDKWGYYHCDTKKAISFYNNGNTLVNLQEPGPIYIISGDADHCKDGQKLTIKVIPLHPRKHSPPAISPAPSPLSNSATTSFSVAMISVLLGLCVSLVSMVLISLA